MMRHRNPFSRQRWLQALLAGSALVCAAPSFAQNVAINGTTETVPSVLRGSAWDMTGTLRVGDTADGALQINSGGEVSNTTGYIGYSNGVTGTATVNGSNSLWKMPGTSLFVGYFGTGVLNITAGGDISNSGAAIGHAAGSSGTATVSGAGSQWQINGAITVGRSGTGTLEISDGGLVSSLYGYIGGDTQLGSSGAGGGTGVVTVSGANSKWSNSGVIHLGNDGTGTLNIGAAAVDPAAEPGIVDAPGVIFDPGTGDLVFNHTSGNYPFAPVITGGAGATSAAVDVVAGTTVMLGASNYYGQTTVYGGAVLAAGRAGALSPNSDYDVQADGTLNLLGFSQTVGSLKHAAGSINMDAAAPAQPGGTTLTVNGNYTGGGALAMGGALNNTSIDVLHVKGDTSGTTTITYTGRAGMLTPKGTDGILVVQVDGASNGTFQLAASPLTVDGFNFTLAKGTLPGNTKNWYLTTTPLFGGPFPTASAAAVPTLNEVALVLLALLLAGGAVLRMRRAR